MDRLKTRQRLAKLNSLGSLQPVAPLRVVDIEPDNELDNAHLASKIRVSSLINQGIPELIYPPKNTLTRISAKEIEDFQRKENTPLEIDGKIYRMHPASVPEPNFDENTDVDIQQALQFASTQASKINDKLQNILRAEARIPVIDSQLQDLTIRYNRFKALQGIQPTDPQLFIAVDREFILKGEVLRDERARLVVFIQNAGAEITADRAELERFNTIDLPQEIAKNNQRKISNKAKLSAYEENLKLLNRNFNLTQEQGESNEAYVARVKSQTEALEDPNLLIDRFNLYEARRFKDNLKDIIRDMSVIESVYNTLFQENDSFIAEINKTFAFIKSRYEKLFGNVQLNEKDLLQFFRQIIQDPEGSIRIDNSRFGDSRFDEDEVLTTLGAEAPAAAGEDPLLSKYRAMSQGRRYNIPGLIERIQKSLDYVNDNLSVNVGGDEAVLIKGARGGISISYRGKIKPASQSEKAVLVAIYVGMLESIKEDGQINDEFATYYKALNKKVNKATNDEYGEGLGIQHETLPKSCKLGKVDVDLNKLFYKNILSCKHKGMKINGVKNTPVSDDFVKIIMDLCKDKYPSSRDLNKLGGGELQTFDALLYLAGLHKRVENTANKSVEKLKQRLALISGEVEAGNTNKDLYAEAKDIVFKLHHLGEITQNAANDFLKQLR